MFKLLLFSTLLAYTYANGAITAAVKSKWGLDIRDTDLPQEAIEPQIIEVPAVELPVKIIFNSRSSGVYVEQNHQQGEKGQVESTKSEEEPHRVVHQVTRPVIQEVRELILPYRRVVQEIQPVVEEVQTIVARGDGRQNNGGQGGSLRSNGGNQGGYSGGNGGYSGGNGGGKGQITVNDLWAAAKAARAAASSRRA